MNIGILLSRCGRTLALAERGGGATWAALLHRRTATTARPQATDEHPRTEGGQRRTPPDDRRRRTTQQRSANDLDQRDRTRRAAKRKPSDGSAASNRSGAHRRPHERCTKPRGTRRRYAQPADRRDKRRPERRAGQHPVRCPALGRVHSPLPPAAPVARQRAGGGLAGSDAARVSRCRELVDPAARRRIGGQRTRCSRPNDEYRSRPGQRGVARPRGER